MPQLIRNVVVPVWVVLVIATALSWWLGHDHALGEDSKKLGTSLVMIVAFVKVALVGGYFMELRHAPQWLQAVFGAWVVVACSAIVGIYLVA